MYENFQPAGDHDGKPMYRVSPGSYIVMDRPMYPQRGQVAQPGMGAWYNDLIEGVTSAAPGIIGAGLDYAASQDERERAARARTQEIALERERMASESATAQAEFERRIVAEEAAAEVASERRRIEHEERLAELRAEAAAGSGIALTPAGLPVWAIALIAVGGVGALGLLVALLIKK